jgi:ABC-type branched-subunit amino acid transport system permease subunit
MNYSLLGADRSTQLKIALVALIAVVAVVAVGARISDSQAGVQVRTNDIVVKAGKPSKYTVREISTIQ